MTLSAGTADRLPPVRPEDDPWDPILSLQRYGKHVLSSVEVTVSNLCNMRCEHCAVGDALTLSEDAMLPVDLLLQRLDEIEHLETISITGGEPTFRTSTVRDVILPLLKYARSRGLRSQINSNLTLERERYEVMAEFLDVMHISFNYTGPGDFHEIGFARQGRPVSETAAAKLYERMIRNAEELSRAGLYISAESMINYRTHRNISVIHRLVAEMGCARHEIHPMYPSDFASRLPVLTLAEYRTAIARLLDERDPEVWILFGTLPFFHCNPDEEDRQLLQRLGREPTVTIRNDPDGRNRLNVDMFTGSVHVTDFAEVPPLGNIKSDSLETVFQRWRVHRLSKQVDCHCPEVGCCGPNLLVADMYYRNVDFSERKAFQ